MWGGGGRWIADGCGWLTDVCVCVDECRADMGKCVTCVWVCGWVTCGCVC